MGQLYTLMWSQKQQYEKHLTEKRENGNRKPGRPKQRKKQIEEAEKNVKAMDDFTSPEKLYDELIASVRKYHPSDDISMIEKAYQIA